MALAQLFRRPNPAPMSRSAAVAAGNGRRKTVSSWILPSGPKSHVVDHFDIYAADLSVGNKEPAVFVKKFLHLAKILEDLEDHIGQSGNLLATSEGELLGEWRVKNRVRPEGVNNCCAVSLLHGHPQCGLSRSVLES